MVISPSAGYIHISKQDRRLQYSASGPQNACFNICRFSAGMFHPCYQRASFSIWMIKSYVVTSTAVQRSCVDSTSGLQLPVEHRATPPKCIIWVEWLSRPIYLNGISYPAVLCGVLPTGEPDQHLRSRHAEGSGYASWHLLLSERSLVGCEVCLGGMIDCYSNIGLRRT